MRYAYRHFPLADMDEEYLNEMGRAGWELVSVIRHHGAWHYFMKRVIE